MDIYYERRHGLWPMISRLTIKRCILDWFHNEHMAEKLARDGYQWGAHYRGQPHHVDGDEYTGYMALFGGVSSAVF